MKTSRGIKKKKCSKHSWEFYKCEGMLRGKDRNLFKCSNCRGIAYESGRGWDAKKRGIVSRYKILDR